MLEQLEVLYRVRLADFCRTAAAIAGDRQLGEDAVQEAFAKAVRKRRRFRGEGSLEAWVWRIVVNAARDARRRRLALAELGEPAAANGPTPALPLELLTDRQREVLSSTTTPTSTTRPSPARSGSARARSARPSRPRGGRSAGR